MSDLLTRRLALLGELAHLPLLGQALHGIERETLRVDEQGQLALTPHPAALGSALTHGLDHAVVLEISPDVVDASRHFDHVNHRPLDDPRTRLIVGDGRTHLLLSDDTYDVIVSEPSNPWMAGIANLFTREFFEIARARLAPGGILCQWAHTYDISEADLKSIVATFLSVFPDGTLWVVGEADVLLIGSTTPLTDRFAAIESAWRRPGVAEDLGSVGARSPLAVYSAFVGEGPALRGWVGDAPLQTDNLAELEFSGPRSVFGGVRSDNARALQDLAASSPRPPVLAAALAQPGVEVDEAVVASYAFGEDDL